MSIFSNNFSGFAQNVRTENKNSPNCNILDSWIFNNFILADELFAKSHLMKDFKVTSVPFFIPDFNQLGYEFDNFKFKVLCWVILVI